MISRFQSRRTGRTSRTIVASLVVGSLVLAACGGDDDDADEAPTVTEQADDAPADDTPADGTSADEAPASSDPVASDDTTPAADEGGNDPSASLTFTYAVPNATLDPARSATPFDLAYMRPVYDTLVRRAEDGSLQPGLATEWEFVDGDLVMTLREGVVFHDGTPFDAEAVKANIERTKTAEGGTQVSFLAPIVAVEVIDPTTVRFDLEGGAGVLAAALTGYPGVMISPAAFGDDLSVTAVGTGPYVLDSNDPGVEVSYVPFDQAWEPDDAAVARLSIITQADAGQRLNQLKTGQAHAANMDPNLIADAEAEGMQVLAKQADNFWSVNFNIEGPLADPDARRAINLAIDREALVEGLDFGYGDASSQIVPDGRPGANPDITYTYDVEQARALAESSGLTGETLVFIGSAIPTITGYQEAIQGMLAEAGIGVEIRSIERAQVTDELRSGNWDMYMNFFPGSADPWLTYNSMFGPESIWFRGERPEALTELMGQALEETDADARAAIFEQLAEVVDENSLIALLAHPRRPVIAVAEVTGFKGNVHAVPELRGTGIRAS